ncbi:reverse transcriptase [Caerostris darwini]|uniref:Reverse transcriptase n=1 Tax=Caerostris darwini TaxID=1538125 RepID=A0AAV4P094_9ARAC|nr:reverse transcriptase [Caerostris darwini]
MTDYFTKYAEVYPVKNIQSSTVCKVLIDFISRHGIMRVLYSDRSSNFISAAMQEVYELLGISKQQCLSYSPQGNGEFESTRERAIFEWKSPNNAELEITVDVSPTSVQRLPSEEEILKEFPPYTLPLETENFLEEEDYENQGINLSRSGEELSEAPEPVVEIQNGEGELVLIPSESNEHQLSSSEEVVGIQTCNSDNSGVIHEGSVSADTKGNRQTENSWGNRLRPRNRSGFVKK